MTAKELIKMLEDFPPDAPLVRQEGSSTTYVPLFEIRGVKLDEVSTMDGPQWHREMTFSSDMVLEGPFEAVEIVG